MSNEHAPNSRAPRGGAFNRRSSFTKLMLKGVLVLLFAWHSAKGADWPQWGGKAERNMGSATEKGLPDYFQPGDDKGDNSAKNVKWVAELGGKTCGSPVVSQGRVFIGSSWKGKGDLLCFDEQTGHELARFIARCPTSGHHTHEQWGFCSTPTIDGDRIYVVSPHQEMLCLDLKALLALKVNHPANDAAETTGEDELKAEQDASEKCIVWKYDFALELDAHQDHVPSCSPLVYGDYVYVCTGNERNKNFSQSTKAYSPLAPSLVVFQKSTGQLVARDDEQIGARLYRGQYTSPSLGIVNGKPQILFAGGDGVCYAFEPVNPSVKVKPNGLLTTTQRGPRIEFYSAKPSGNKSNGEMPKATDSTGATDSSGPVERRPSIELPAMSPPGAIPTAKVPDVPILKKIWSADCIPPEYRSLPFYAHGSKSDGQAHPCEIIGTPVLYNNRVYLAIGGDPNHGGTNSKGNILCIDATKTGDVTQSGLVWNNKDISHCMATLAVADGLVYAADETGVVHCFDADTGKTCWKHATKREPFYCSPFVADGKVYIQGLILAANKNFKLLSGERIKGEYFSSSCAANGVLYLFADRKLWAVCNGK